jgi:hypothetical protein
MKSVLYALIGVSSLVTFVQINQVNVNIQLSTLQSTTSAQPSPPASTPSCGSEYQNMSVSVLKK